MFWIPNQLEAAYKGQEVTIECHSEAFPKSINYWVRKDGQMLVSSKYKTSEDSIRIVTAYEKRLKKA